QAHGLGGEGVVVVGRQGAQQCAVPGAQPGPDLGQREAVHHGRLRTGTRVGGQGPVALEAGAGGRVVAGLPAAEGTVGAGLVADRGPGEDEQGVAGGGLVDLVEVGGDGLPGGLGAGVAVEVAAVVDGGGG